MARRRTGERPRAELSRRARAWRGVKDSFKKIKETDVVSPWRTGIFIAAVVSGLWTNSIRVQTNETADELTKLKAAVILKDAKHESEMLTVNNRMDSCEKRMRDKDEQIKAIRDEAKKLPPSPQKRRILTLTQREPVKSGAVMPMRADELTLPSPEQAYPHIKRNWNE